MMRAGRPLSEEQDPIPQEDTALLAAGRILQGCGYAFTTITPASHARVLARRARAEARTLRDVFGWNLPFHPQVIGTDLLELLRGAGWLQQEGEAVWRSNVRFSSLGTLL